MRKSVVVLGVAALAWLVVGGAAVAAPATTQAPVAATRLVPAQPSLAGPERIGVLVFFDFTRASETLLARLPTWLGDTGRPIVLDREPVVTGTDATPFARAFMVARTLGVTSSVLPALVKLAQAGSANGQSQSRQQSTGKMRAAIAAAFAQVGINQIEFTAAWNAPATSAGLVRARAMSARFQVASAPVLIVNGQWKLLPSAAASVTDILTALNVKLAAAAARIAANR